MFNSILKKFKDPNINWEFILLLLLLLIFVSKITLLSPKDWKKEKSREPQFIENFETDPSLPIPEAFSAVFIPGEKPFIQLTWDYYIADFFNIYRATDPSGPWERIFYLYPGAAHGAIDYDFPKNAKVLYYKITSVKGMKESLPSKISAVKIRE